MCMGILFVCMYVHALGVYGGQKRTLDPLEQELPVSHHVGTVIVRQGLSMQLRLAQNSLCPSGWPHTQRSSDSFAEIEGMHHLTQLQTHFTLCCVHVCTCKVEVRG